MVIGAERPRLVWTQWCRPSSRRRVLILDVRFVSIVSRLGLDTLYLIVSTGAHLYLESTTYHHYYYTTRGAAAGAPINRHQRLGHDLAFAALGKGRDVCTTPGAVRVGVVATGGSLPTAVLAAYKSATLYPSILCTFVSAIVSALYPDLGWKQCITVYPQMLRVVFGI